MPGSKPFERHLPVRPDLDQLRYQAKDMLKALRKGDQRALAEFASTHPEGVGPGEAQLADAQLVLARSYGAVSWPRLVRCCELVDAIWENDIGKVRKLVMVSPQLIHDDALVRPDGRKSNWGPPMSYAANLGRDRIIQMMHDLGATDHEHAIGRAMLQSQISTARKLYNLMGKPPAPDDALGGPAYTLSLAGTEFALDIGARVVDQAGRRLAPVDVVLETDSRNPKAKHAILELYGDHGLGYPDTPTMALHRGRVDLLEAHLKRDPELLSRTFGHEEIYPPELGCHDEVLATHGTPLTGATLLHMCCDYDEIEIAQWLISKGANVNARAAVDGDGFGGHTALFSTVVSQANYWMNHRDELQIAPMTRLLIENGADLNVRASLRKKLHPGYDPNDSLREYRDVTALSWGRRFHFRKLVSEPAMKLIEAAGGRE
jgi:hypothetical protein